MKIYVSSTFDDLKDFRREVHAQLRKLGTDVVAMEDYVASEKRPLAKCLEDVAECDLYVGIFAWRYGFVPVEDGNPESRSITELEYHAAGRHGKARLVFLLREDAPWTPRLMDTHTGEGEGGRRIARLREELGENHQVGFFTNPDDLAREVSAAVSKAHIAHVRRLSDVRVGDEPSQAIVTSTISVSDTRDPLALTWSRLSRGLDVAHAVGRIEDVAGAQTASGFLVSGASLHPTFGPDLYMLTPAHIIVPEKTHQSFGLTAADATLRLTIPNEAREPIRLAGIAWYSPVDELDLSLVRLERQPEGVRGLTVAARLPVANHSSGPVEKVFDDQASVNVVGHPAGRELTFSLGGRLLAQDETRVQYTAVTHKGSGGSPVFDESWHVIGVHRLRGDLPVLGGQGRHHACEAVSLPAICRALRAEFGSGGDP